MIITTTLTSQQLRQAADLKEKIEALQSELDRVMSFQESAPVAPESPESFGPSNNGKPKKRQMSAEGRASIRAAQKARWAKKRGEVQGEATPAKAQTKAGKGLKKKQLSAAKLAGLAKARAARWAKFHAAKEG
jgi:hypothetical protein